MGNAVEPTRPRVSVLHRPELLGQKQKRGLECVLAVLRMLQDAPANAIDHRPMPTYQGLEYHIVASGEVAFDEFPVRPVHYRFGGHSPCYAAEKVTQLRGCHVCPTKLWLLSE